MLRWCGEKRISLKGDKMTAKKYWILAVVVACCVAFLSMTVFGISLQEKGQLKRFGISTLHGLKGVCPIVLLFTDEETKLQWVSEYSLQGQVELELRKAGITVSEAAESFEGQFSSEGQFFVVVHVTKLNDLPLYHIIFTARLSQIVVLARNPKIRTFAPTWSTTLEPESQGGIVSADLLDRAIKEMVGKTTTNFINDYLAANPKKQTVEEPKKPIDFRPEMENNKKLKDN